MSNSRSRNLPAEWEPQAGVLLAWPQADSDWQENLQAVRSVYCQIIAIISRSETVLLLCHAGDQQPILTQLNTFHARPERIVFAPCRYNDTWTRDYGPITVRDASGKPHLLDFCFNGWGNKFDSTLDNAITRQLHAAGQLLADYTDHLDFVLEGGSIESDGRGTLLTTRQCLLNANRNPQRELAQIEQQLQQSLGAERILWLEHGYLAGDDTDSHIDTLARFCPNDVIVYMACNDPGDEHFDSLQRMREELEQLRTVDGNPYRLLPILLPKPMVDDQQRRLPASYVNFLIINEAVLLPIYGDPVADHAAQATLQQAFPSHPIHAIDCKPLILQNGSLHCITMQIPDGISIQSG